MDATPLRFQEVGERAEIELEELRPRGSRGYDEVQGRVHPEHRGHEAAVQHDVCVGGSLLPTSEPAETVDAEQSAEPGHQLRAERVHVGP